MRECIKCGGLVEPHMKICGTCGSKAVRNIQQPTGAPSSDQRARADHQANRSRSRIASDKTMIKGLVITVVVCSIPFVSHFTEVKKVETKVSDYCPKSAIHCVARKVDTDASIQCRDAIDRQLAHGGEWDGGLPAFSRYWWVGKDNEVIAFSGSNLQVKNSLGLTVTASFICEYDVVTNSIVKAGLLTP